ncbi:MAG: hypothetical protein D6816_19425 [Bacteroidetes bacterium]|nr:MAG: hypothetical protein D6816_19425 [Bacteroidota bacterium]
MKSITNYLTLAAFCIPLVMASCKKEEAQPQVQEQEAMSEQEAEAVTEIMAIAAIEDVEATAEAAESYAPSDQEIARTFCGETFDTTLEFHYQYLTLNVDYVTSWGLKVNCNNLNIPKSLEVTGTGTGNVTAALMDGSLNGASDGLLEGLLPDKDVYTFNGTYAGTGTLQSKVGLKNSYSVIATVSLDDITIDKETLFVTGGSGTMAIEATSSTGKTGAFTATFIINGDGTATIEINGNSFTIHL